MTRHASSPFSPTPDIRSRALQAVTSSSQSTTFDTLEGYVVIDGAGTIQEVSREAAALLRSSPAALRGKPMLRYLERESRKLFLSMLRRLHTSDQVEALEVALQPQHGPVVHATLTVLASRDATGKFLTLHCQFSNVNANLWQASLVAQSDSLPTSEASTTLFTHDLNGTILFVSQAVAGALGYKARHMIGHSLAEFLVAAEQRQFNNYLHIAQHGPVLDRVLRLSTKSGKDFVFPYRHARYEVAGHALYIHLYTNEALLGLQPPTHSDLQDSGRHIQDRAEELARINAALQREIADRTRAEEELKQAREELERRVAARTVELSQANILLEQEISERRQTQEALRDSEARYRLLSASAPIGIAQADTAGELVYTNARWQALAGLTLEATLGHGWLHAIHAEDRATVTTAWTTAIAKGREFAQEWRFMLPSGEIRWVHARATPLQSSEGELVGYVSTLEDVTAQKSAQALLQEEAQVSRAQTIALAQTLKALTAEPALDSFLSQVLTAIAQQLKAQGASLWLYEKSQENFSPYMLCENGTTQIITQNPTSPSPLRMMDESQFWPELVQTHRPILVTDIEHEQRLGDRALLHAHGIQTILLVPLVLEDEAAGWLSLHSTASNSYRPEEIELAQALAQQVALAMQLADFAEQRRQAAIIEERNRLAREIHDTLAQGLTGIVIQLEAAKEVLATAPDTAQSHIVRAAALARDSLMEARRSVRALRPQALDHQDLPTALEHLAVQLSASTQIPISFALHGTPCSLPAEFAANLLRISQEAIINAWKHAQPQTITLDLNFTPHEVQLRVHDNGRGFDTHNSPAGSGFGLTSMRERAERLGGHFMLTSTLGQGTEVAISIPNSQLT